MANWLTKLFSDTKDKPVEVQTGKTNVVLTQPTPKRVWRNNMWVMTPNGVGIIFALAEPVTVHLVDVNTGETLRSALYSSHDIRQARYEEIPSTRRGTREKAVELGYI